MHLDLRTMQFANTTIDEDRLAVAGSDRSLCWAELQAEVARWCRQAQNMGLQRDMPIVLAGHKEAHFFVAMAGCLILGAPFVPVDTIYPAERRQKITDIIKAPLVYDAAGRTFTRSSHTFAALPEKDLAYVLFTSGSTGEPKGVQIGRESVRLLGDWMQSRFGLGHAPVFMNQAPFSFDLSMFEVFDTLASGGACILNSREQIQDATGFLQRLGQHRVTCWVSTPSFAHQQLLNKDFAGEFLPSLDTFLFCGEVLPHALCKRLLQRFPKAKILNTYGPTEATVATTLVEIDQTVLDTHTVLPVGYPKPDCEIVIVDGEICIIGDHVMRGYLNRPELNREKLFIHSNGQRGFKTGDLGQIDEAGLLWCQGRRDDQVKLNGYRIELAEISRALQALDEVKAAICVALRRADQTVARLLGFVELEPSSGRTATTEWAPYPAEQWKPQLEQRLPPYMLPSEILTVTALPMSVNHKIDGKALLQGYLKL
ncbi:MAG: D-alanine--poly(phosphoribitol) ligase [Candidimonas sp.]|nr:MAG: D-alanine--poly(phosphoribitol) ligase [Candidimonas sp.]TAM19538.1 MAG: D-alanine--poly(phosphoribitol) ligase [Candidimonas sp.]TAM80144.1 MAG: D-alanine--poly(phosphoribitol) ligase [Candidimonas sp.]